MQKLRRTKLCRATASNRRGMAPIELTMFLPLLLALFTIIMSIVSASLTRSAVAMEARHLAWGRRFSGPSPNTLQVETARTRRVGVILDGTDPNAGVIRESSSQSAYMYFPGFRNFFPPVQNEHVVLADSWDHETIPFEPQSQHPRLRPSEKFYRFANPLGGGFDFSTFSGLGSFAGSFFSQAAQAATNVNRARQSARAEIERQMREVQSRIDRFRGILSQTRTQLARARRARQPDGDAIRRLEQKIVQLEGQIERFEGRMDELRAGLNHL